MPLPQFATHIEQVNVQMSSVRRRLHPVCERDREWAAACWPWRAAATGAACACTGTAALGLPEDQAPPQLPLKSHELILPWEEGRNAEQAERGWAWAREGMQKTALGGCCAPAGDHQHTKKVKTYESGNRKCARIALERFGGTNTDER